MALTEVRKAALMAYCRLTELAPGEEALLETLYDGAVSYLTQAGVAQPAAETPRRAQYDLAVNYLVLDAYDNRDTALAPGGTGGENPAFRRLITQLKLTEPVSEAETEENVSNLDTGESG
jgi:hypothetical protein